MIKESKNRPQQLIPFSSDKFPVVAIGSSAGGFDALKKFFTNMPSDLGIAFVIVQHLDPTHKSNMAELMSRYTELKVTQARDGMSVKPNTLYIIPPNKDMGIINRKLELIEPTEPHGLRLPINFFFNNLAEDQKEQSIAIIFSGYGSDGKLGIKAIKAEGGMVMVQEPKTAESDSMPESAIETGLVDFILAPEEMPEKLISYINSSNVPIKKIVSPKEDNENALQKIFILIRNRYGQDFSKYKENTIYRRISRRMNVNQIESIPLYLRYLQENPTEIDILFKELLINVTNFFRDEDAFGALKDTLRTLISKKSDIDNIRIWIPGCSSGEETYSIAIIINELLMETDKNIDVQIFGTDIDMEAINTARSAKYPINISTNVSPERLKKYFTKKDNVYVIKSIIREMVVFAQHNVLKDPPFTRLDLLSCRNLLIYLNSEAQASALSKFNYALNNNGILFLGPSENVGDFMDAFSTVNKKWKIFKSIKSSEFAQKFEDVNPLPRIMSMPNFNTKYQLKTLKDEDMPINITSIIEKKLLNIYTPPSAIITDFGEILYIHGRLGNYLEPAQGKAKLNIIDMARDGLKFELNSAIKNAISKKNEVVVEGLIVKNNGDSIFVNINVKPIQIEKSKGLLIVSFEPVELDKKGKKNKIKLDMVTKGDERIKELENDLKLTKERLNITIEELKTSNEELRSANEELQSMNEEAQSTNEELETSKEELQSINEELITVNNELQMKIDELTRTKDDLNNLFNSTEIAIIFLDNNLNIRRFTKEATKLVKMRKSDIGRPISDIVSNLMYDKLMDDIQEVIDTVTFKEIEIETNTSEWLSARIMPYKTSKNVIDGVLITFTNITKRKKETTNALDAFEFADSIVQSVRDPLLVLDQEMHVILANQSFYNNFKVEPQKTINHTIYDLGNKQWNLPSLKKLLSDILPKKTEVNNYIVEENFPNIGTRKILLNARQIYQKGIETYMILVTLQDITEK
jgi:two-component system, chemotaxis family, CheB/CheR fusion protein